MPDNFPLYLVLMWHMHQPYYKDIRTGKYIMPWVRLHATKDYLDMVELLGDYPNIKAVFNMVPSLVEQIDDHVNHGATDLVWDMTVRPANHLNDGEKKFILQKFFYTHYDNMIKPFPRYRELYEKRGWAKNDSELTRAAYYFHESDFRDLQVWYNLTWIDPLFRDNDEFLSGLVEKGRDFTEEEKLRVLDKQLELMRRIVPTYRAAQERRQVELSFTPFYHPILPLVYDTNLARVARPNIALPRHRFSQPGDAEAQVEAGARYHETMFGVRPTGMWPSEGSVAPEILPIIAKQQVRWIATDEEILANSAGQAIKRDLKGVLQNPELLYAPYVAEHQDARVAMIFRDHFLSDLIGFQYAGWQYEDAAVDLVSRIESVAKGIKTTGKPALMSIILDGENCWEHYENDGLPFLRSLYERLSASRLVKTTRVCDYLDEFPPTNVLPRLFTGSWINHDFSIWIGHKEDNQSWDYLFEIREAIEQHIREHKDELTEEQIRTAWKEIYIAEGSDWNWWYGDDHSSGIDEEFDQLYRDHLMCACQAVNLQPPAFLYIPIKTRGVTGFVTQPKAFLKPVLDGRNTTYYEWFAAGRFEPGFGGGSMHQAQYLIRRLFFGFDSRNLFFRLDAEHTLLKPESNDVVTLNIYLITPHTWKLSITMNGEARLGPEAIATLEREIQNHMHPVCCITSIAVDQIVEVGLAFSAVELTSGQEVYFYVTLEINGREMERCPVRSPIRIEVPAADFETKMWVV